MKTRLARTFCSFGTDRLLRAQQKKRLLIVTYHGICQSSDQPDLPLFTQLSVDLFRQQLEFFKTHYQIVSLSDVETFIKTGKPYSDRSVLITFDDGFKNNYQYAYPLLKEYNLPAAVFLVVDYVGTEQLLWFDELFLLLRQVDKGALSADDIIFGLSGVSRKEGLQKMYATASSHFKKMTLEERTRRISQLKERVDIDSDPLFEHFKLMSWDQVKEMKDSGLIDFGIHTASHRILSELSPDDYQQELVAPRRKLSQKLNCEISSFCYPNGIPDIDFTAEHEKFLKKNGYVCAFSTYEQLNKSGQNKFRLGRFSVGSDLTSDPCLFRLRMSGLSSLRHVFF